VPDAGKPDAGVPDAGKPDAGLTDAGPSDAGAADAGHADAGPPGDPYRCDGGGLVWVVPDPCIDDYGGTAGGDSLEIYCQDGVARFCLSYEDCPWRDGGRVSDPLGTCSRAGIGATTTCMSTLADPACTMNWFDVQAVECIPEGDAGLGTANLDGGCSF
jgi:hypothetical protein